MPRALCCSPTPSFDLLPIVLVGGALLLGRWMWRKRNRTNDKELHTMKPIQKTLILVALLAAVGFVMAKRNQSTKVEPAEVTAPAVAEKPMPRLVDLGAGKCIPCKAMAPILEELRREYAGVFEIVFIDVWENPPAAEPYNINLIPTQIFFDAEGKELWRHEGFLAKADILAKWKELGLEL